MVDSERLITTKAYAYLVLPRRATGQVQDWETMGFQLVLALVLKVVVIAKACLIDLQGNRLA